MSYILDALRKADAQRMRDPARGIHAQASVAAVVTAARPRRSELWLAGAAAIVILVAAAWLWRSREDTAAPVVVAASPALAVAAPPAASVLPAAPPVVIAAPEVRRAAPPAAPPKLPLPAVQQPAATAPPALVASAAAAPAERSYRLAELPADVRQALPKFTVSGGVYSVNVAQRMLIVNGQVFNEGSEIAPGVVLEQVQPHSALLKFRGVRIAQPY
jgi:general secretion pathway protein B